MLHIRNMHCAAIAAAAVFCFAASDSSIAQAATAKKVVYHVAGGMFATPSVSGADQLELAGNPFQLSLIAGPTKPAKHGKGWAIYTDMDMQGSVTSTARPGKPFPVHSKHAVLFLSVGNAAYDEFKLTFQYSVSGVPITFVADVQMPKGTLTGFEIKPFNNSVTLTNTPPNATVTYSATVSGTKESTELDISAGTFTGTAGAPPASVNP